MNKEQEKLHNLRHSLAHLLAAAVLDIYPNAKPTIGPPVEDGFYYDFDFDGNSPADKDLPKIEKRMRKLLPKWDKFEGREVSPEEAKKYWKNNPYKLELIAELGKEKQKISFYKSGEFTDLCRGGHVLSPKKEIQFDAFKLTKVAGAYWRGSEKNKMLTRIYGVAFETKHKLDEYLAMQEEAKKRDHRKLGKDLDLFTFSEVVGAGLPLWTPKGALLRNLLDGYVWQLRKKKGFSKVEIPHITKKDLYLISGHWKKFKDELFRIRTREDHEFAMKPMNCPHHIEIFKRKKHSYRELPQRFANTTMVYRDEQTGELNGLSRVRCITQDDAHVFCRLSQVGKEIAGLWEVITKFYKASGKFNLRIRLSLYDPKHPEKYLGKPEIWDKAQAELKKAIKAKKVKFEEAEGEAAFYGPKIDFMANDSLGREWQLATIQLDMNLPEQFDLTCTNEKGEPERIVMLHCAVMGSIERYLSILIEHLAGHFPLWLSSVQVVVMPITSKQKKYALQVAKDLQKQIDDLRIEINDRDESIGRKIREATLQKVPYQIIVGEKEVKAKKVSIRTAKGKDLGPMSLKKLIELVNKQIVGKK